MSLREAQAQYEESTDATAAADRLTKLRADAAAGKLNLPKTSAFIARAYADVRDAVLAAQTTVGRGSGSKFKTWLRSVPAEVVAVLSIRECIRFASASATRNKPITVQRLGISIGRLIETEVRIKEAERVNPLYMKRIHDQVREHNSTNQEHLRRLYNTAYDRVMHGEIDSQLTSAEALQLGKFGVQACLDAGILVTNVTAGAKGRMHCFNLAPEVDKFLLDYSSSDVQSVINTGTGAMMCPPDPWTDLQDGGYVTAKRKRAQPLMSLMDIRRSERPRLRKEFTAERMPLVFRAANYLQEKPLCIHEATLRAVQAAWEAGGGVMGIPRKNPPVAPAFPFAEDWQSASASEEELLVHRAWRRQTAQYHMALREWRGKVREIGGFLRVSKQIQGPMWFPVFFDKRGRWYYRGTPNPQGSDISKAVLHFHEKKPLGKAGLYWLKVHIANCYGYDKTRFDDRVRWTERHWEVISRALDDPLSHLDVWGTDNPWCMFAAATELAAAYRSGNPEQYSTGIVVHMDATCSGLQHFSAMLRDPVGGRYVNLVDSGGETKEDIYARVAANAMAGITEEQSSTDEQQAALAQWWAGVGIPRKMAKKPVMTYVYGATLRGTVDFVEDFVETELVLPWPEGYRPYDTAQVAAKKLFQGIAATVPSAAYAMEWLKSVARSMPKGRRMEWRTPTGFLVQHDYQGYDEIRVRLNSCGTTLALVREYNDSTVPTQMQNAIAPNFVHALDSSHLTLVALGMQDAGLSMVAIHDSFGTHPCDVSSMHSIIREKFVEMYRDRNVLAEFLWEVKGVGEPPLRGDLDLDKVLKSEFFFC